MEKIRNWLTAKKVKDNFSIAHRNTNDLDLRLEGLFRTCKELYHEQQDQLESILFQMGSFMDMIFEFQKGQGSTSVTLSDQIKKTAVKPAKVSKKITKKAKKSK